MVAIFSSSWGGVLFGLMIDTPVIMRVAWRLSIGTCFQIFGFGYDWRHCSPELRRRWLKSVPLLVLNGVILAVHFSAFAASIEYTSFSNSMLIVSTPPLFFVLQAMALWACGVYLRRLIGPAGLDAVARMTTTSGEVSGAAIGDKLPAALEDLSREEDDAKREGDVNDIAPGNDDANGLSHKKTRRAQQHLAVGESRRGLAASESVRDMRLDGGGICDGTPSASAGAAVAVSASGTAPPAPQWAIRSLLWLRGTSTHPSAPLPPTAFEVLGTAVAMGGMVALVLLTAAEAAASAASGATPSNNNRMIRPASTYGDVCAVITALCMYAYLAIGRALRAWMPLWMYFGPITLTAATLTSAVSLGWEEGTSFSGADAAGLFGWLFHPRLMGIAVAAGFVPTILGHGLTNLSVKYISPLVVSIFGLLQPIVGGVYGYALGVAAVPSVVTLAAGPTILLGILLVITGSRTSACPPHTWLPALSELVKGGGSFKSCDKAQAANGASVAVDAEAAPAADKLGSDRDHDHSHNSVGSLASTASTAIQVAEDEESGTMAHCGNVPVSDSAAVADSGTVLATQGFAVRPHR